MRELRRCRLIERRHFSEGRGTSLEDADRRLLRVDPGDNLAIALVPLPRGTQVVIDGQTIELATDIPAKHKFVVELRAVGDEVRMYGIIVGKATKPIAKGEVVSTLNVTHATSGFRAKSRSYSWTEPDVTRWRTRTFLGYHRNDGQVGTRNYWLVVPLVFCENRNILAMKEALEEELGFAPPLAYRQFVSKLKASLRSGADHALDAPTPLSSDAANRRVFPNVDGIKFLIHQAGCGGTREDAQNLCGLIAGYINHPNVAGATVLSLGCQHSQVEMLEGEIDKRNPSLAKPLHIFEQQKSKSESEMLLKAIRETFYGVAAADQSDRREPAPLSKLRVGLKCGGSDGFSGISANPVVGRVSDIVVALGGATILSEFPELCGVEQELIERCVNDEVAERFIHLMTDYSARAKAVRSAFDMNPSPGNIRDGLVTDAMKSAGAAKKGGTAPVSAVIDYPEYSRSQGLHLQCTPGNDVECVTAQVGAGANIVLFTTGLGTPTGNPVAPVVKIATNTELVRRMPEIIDYDSGGVVEGTTTIEENSEGLLEQMIAIASGELAVRAESLRQDDFIPWKRGVSL